MDNYATSSPKYSDIQQPGLEVSSVPYKAEQTRLPNATQPDWGVNSTEAMVENQGYPSNGKKQILGLSVGTFWGIVVLLCVVVAGGIGGGVGAGLASRKSACASDLQTNCTALGANANPGVFTSTTIVTASATSGATPTTTATDSSVSPAPSSHCTDQTSFNGSILTPLDATGKPIALAGTTEQTFQVLCNTNWPSGSTYGNPSIHDIMKIYQPDLPHCVAACAEYNAAYAINVGAGVAVGGGYCKAVSLILEAGEFCYLKNGTATNITSTSGPSIDSALLQ